MNTPLNIPSLLSRRIAWLVWNLSYIVAAYLWLIHDQTPIGYVLKAQLTVDIVILVLIYITPLARETMRAVGPTLPTSVEVVPHAVLIGALGIHGHLLLAVLFLLLMVGQQSVYWPDTRE